jgi:transcriptional regulator of arginine metabolism
MHNNRRGMNHWRDQLRDLVASGRFQTQQELVSGLGAHGVVVNQGTVSRELHRLGAIKRGGFYAMPDELPAVPVPVHALHVTAGGCLLVLKTDPAFASVLGQSIDDAKFAGVLGTIAGDDTVFVATSGPRVAHDVAAHFDIALEA